MIHIKGSLHISTCIDIFSSLVFWLVGIFFIAFYSAQQRMYPSFLLSPLKKERSDSVQYHIYLVSEVA